ncbi:MAG: YIP1 family protein [Terriglobales bacterium]
MRKPKTEEEPKKSKAPKPKAKEEPVEKAAPEQKDADDDDDDLDDEEEDETPVVDEEELLPELLKTKFYEDYFVSTDFAGFFRHFYELSKMILLTPYKFFAVMPQKGGYREPLIFLGTGTLIYSIIHALLKGDFLSLFMSFFESIIAIGLGATVAHFACQKLGGKGTLEATFRVFAYSRATIIFAWFQLGWFPLGWLVAGIYTLALNIVGLQKLNPDVERKNLAMIVGVVGAIGLAFVFMLFGSHPPQPH